MFRFGGFMGTCKVGICPELAWPSFEPGTREPKFLDRRLLPLGSSCSCQCWSQEVLLMMGGAEICDTLETQAES